MNPTHPSRHAARVTITIVLCLLVTACGSSSPKKATPQPSLENVKGTIATIPADASTIEIEEHSGGIRSLLVDGELPDEAQVRSMAASKEPVIAFFRSQDKGDVLVRIEKAPAIEEDVPRATGLLTAVGKDGAMTLKTDDGEYTFIVLEEELEFFDYEHLLEHKTDKAPITIYYEAPETKGARKGLVYIGFDDA